MDFTLNELQTRARDLAREFAEREIIPTARDNDVQERFPAETIRKMGEAGLLGGVIPVQYGGSAFDHISDALIFEEIGRGCSSVRTTMSVQVSLVEQTIFRFGSEAQKERYLPRLCRGEMLGCFALTEPGAGSDAAGITTKAQRMGDGWLLDGTKTWITNGGVADVAVVFARTGPAGGAGGISAFIVERGTAGFASTGDQGEARSAGVQYRRAHLQGVPGPRRCAPG